MSEATKPLSAQERAELVLRWQVPGHQDLCGYLWDIAPECYDINGKIMSIGPLSGYDGDALDLDRDNPVDWAVVVAVSHAPEDVARLLATCDALEARAESAEAALRLAEALHVWADHRYGAGVAPICCYHWSAYQEECGSCLGCEANAAYWTYVAVVTKECEREAVGY